MGDTEKNQNEFVETKNNSESSNGCLLSIINVISAVFKYIFGGVIQIIIFLALIIWILSSIHGDSMGNIISDILKVFI